MTRSGTYKLRVELSDFYGDSAYAEYDNFSISGADDNFRLSVGRYTGTAGSVSYANANWGPVSRDPPKGLTRGAKPP
nr:hypothetical protein BaRGS_002268 [Batillaria attramentaria]